MNDFKNAMRQLMTEAWSFVKKNGFTMSEAMRVAWANLKLKTEMKKRIVRFYFRKVDGTIREAYGTLVSSMLPPTKGTCKPASPTTQTYYDTEREQYRCFKKANLINVVI